MTRGVESKRSSPAMVCTKHFHALTRTGKPERMRSSFIREAAPQTKFFHSHAPGRTACPSSSFNHSMRAAVSAMRQLCDRLFAEENATTIEPNIADLEEVFDMLQYDELARAEKRYLQPNKR
ncbi:hypothetical protein AB7M74_002871 [Bradyrhizobium japonicum]